MPPIEAELRRRDSLGDLQDWRLRDPLPADGGLHTDPVSDLTAHTKLQSAVDKLTDAVAALQGTLAVSGTVNIGTMPQVNVGTVEVTNDAGSPLPVSGTIALDASSLAALETINAIVSGSVGVTGPVALDSATLTALENIVVSGSVALDAATLSALENIVVSGTVALDSATLSALETITAVVSGSVSVSNFPATQAVTGPLTDAQLRAAPVVVDADFPATTDVSDRIARQVGQVRDRYTAGESLADQTGDGTAKTFTFISAVDLIWVRCDGGDGRADPFGGTPTTSAGIFCEDAVPNPITVSTGSVKVWADVGVVMRVWGFRY